MNCNSMTCFRLYKYAKETRDAQKQYFLNNDFRPKFSNWAQAQREFIKAAQPFTFEELTANNADEVLLSVLGVPRYLNGDADRLGRILFLFYWKHEDFNQRYGSDDVVQMEDRLRNVFKQLGELTLNLKEKAVRKS